MLKISTILILVGFLTGCAGGYTVVTERVYTPSYYADPYVTPYYYYYNVDPYPYWY